MNRRNRKRVIGATKRYLVPVAKRCNNIQCPLADKINEALYILALVCEDCGKPLELDKLPEKVRKKVGTHRFVTRVLEYYSRCPNCGGKTVLRHGELVCLRCKARKTKLEFPASPFSDLKE